MNMIPKRSVSDELLRLTVEAKIEAGANPASVRELTEAFASYHDQGPSEGTKGIVGFLGVEDIPCDRRGTFLMALLALADDPNRRSLNLRPKVADCTSPKSWWTRLRRPAELGV